ncbi:MAG TPA: hypothetical protein VGM62_02020, partial [Chthoniobacterales bacterium]
MCPVILIIRTENSRNNQAVGRKTTFGLIVTVAFLAVANVSGQQAPSAGNPNSQPAGDEQTVTRVVERIMQPYLAQEQRTVGGHLWKRSPNLGTIVAVSMHGHRYFFPFGKATDAG